LLEGLCYKGCGSKQAPRMPPIGSGLSTCTDGAPKWSEKHHVCRHGSIPWAAAAVGTVCDDPPHPIPALRAQVVRGNSIITIEALEPISS